MKHDLSLSTIYTSILSHEMTKQYEFLQRTRNKNATHSYKHPFIQQNTITTKNDLNKCVFRISGAVKNNIPEMEPTCPNSKMLFF